MDQRQVWAEWRAGGGGRTPLEVEADGQRLVHHAHQQRGGSLQTERDDIFHSNWPSCDRKLVFYMSEARTLI